MSAKELSHTERVARIAEVKLRWVNARTADKTAAEEVDALGTIAQAKQKALDNLPANASPAQVEASQQAVTDAAIEVGIAGTALTELRGSSKKFDEVLQLCCTTLGLRVPVISGEARASDGLVSPRPGTWLARLAAAF